MDSESYVHRIGRTGRVMLPRALFVGESERRLLRNIERTMKLTILEVELPNAELLGKRRLENLPPVQQQPESSDLDQGNRRGWRKSSRLLKVKSWISKPWPRTLLKMAQGERPLILPPDAPMRP